MPLKKMGSTTLKDVRALEQKYNLKLLQDYINFLLACNGGAVDPEEDADYVIFVKKLKH